MWNSFNTVFRGTFIALNAYIRKFWKQSLRGRTTLNPKHKRKEIIQTTAEINEIEKAGNQ